MWGTGTWSPGVGVPLASEKIPLFCWENRCRDVMTACRSFVSRGCRNCCGLRKEGPGQFTEGNRPDGEAGHIWQLKTWQLLPCWGYESDGCVLKENLSSGVRLKMFQTVYIADLILNPHRPQWRFKRLLTWRPTHISSVSDLCVTVYVQNHVDFSFILSFSGSKSQRNNRSSQKKNRKQNNCHHGEFEPPVQNCGHKTL